MNIAIYAFSGDPITYGHMDIIERASKVFGKVLVGIGINPSKEYMFSLDERKLMAEKSTAHLSNVDVVSFKGLLVDYAYENGIFVIVKGVRNASDFNYENILHQVGESQKLGIDTYILFAKPELAHISSSIVKSIQNEQGLVHEYVPLYVKLCLEERISNQFIIGVTGEIGSGKSYISCKFEEIAKAKGITVHNLDLDKIGHNILGKLKEPKYQQVREQIIETFGSRVDVGDGTINRKVLGDIVFNDSVALNKLNAIMYTPMLVRIRRNLYGKKGLILIDAALMVETDMTYLCNNNIILVNTDISSQKRRLKGKGFSDEQIDRRLKSQYCYQDKKKMMEQIISRDKQGYIWTIDNFDSSDGSEIKLLFENIIGELKVK
ncbi:MAG: pantetheine-phosphate adenylyltransferase [DPANN group archaeon]|nr:pantetheine-phosphate adenylyltransferase [DPANN group archaeon]